MTTLIDSKELAAALNLPVRTLDQWAYQGKGPRFVKIGRHRRYRMADVEAWLAERVKGGDHA